MSLKGILLTLFWIFLAFMVVKSAMDYNSRIVQASQHQQTHFFYHNPNAPDANDNTIAPGLYAAKVLQVNYWTVPDPSTSSFTGYVVVRNVGNARAINIEFRVRPYRGAVINADGLGHQYSGVISDEDALAQISQMISVPDLDPGETTTQTVSFPARPEIGPGPNPKPEIIFQTQKTP